MRETFEFGIKFNAYTVTKYDINVSFKQNCELNITLI